jgi:DNA/RNA endonuclease G (NUC1)
VTHARKNKKTWADLSDTQRRLIVAGGVVEAVVTAVALRDLATRPSAQVRGPKLLWLLGCVVQPVGPLAYLWVGRR